MACLFRSGRRLSRPGMAALLGRPRSTVRTAASRPAKRPPRAPADSEVDRYEFYPLIEME